MNQKKKNKNVVYTDRTGNRTRYKMFLQRCCWLFKCSRMLCCADCK